MTEQTQAEVATRTRSRRAAAPEAPPAPEPRNEVRLVGRVSAPPEERELPSGDRVVTWRLVVDRPPSRRAARAGVRVPTIDTLDCAAWAAAPRRTARALQAGDVAEVVGALRKRFWRAAGGPSSRTEVEVETVRRLARG